MSTVEADGAEAQIREFLLHLKEKTIGLSRDKAIRATLESSDSAKDSARLTIASRLSEDFAERQQEFPDAQEIFVIDPHGRVLASSVSASVGRDVCESDSATHCFTPPLGWAWWWLSWFTI